MDAAFFIERKFIVDRKMQSGRLIPIKYDEQSILLFL